VSIPALDPDSTLDPAPSLLLGRLLDADRALDAAALGELTRQIAGRPALWRPLLRHDPDHRWYERLLLTPRVEVWLIGWAPGQGTLPHDHGDAEGALTVTEGTLTEDVYLGVRPEDGEVAPSRTLERRAGSTTAFTADHVHRVSNRGAVNATSIHAYSPPGRQMRYYGTPAERRTPAAVLGIDDVLRRARQGLTRLSPSQTQRAVGSGALLVDIRPQGRREAEGSIPGALVIERNLLEWRLDPQSPWRLPEVRGHDQQIIVFCSEGYTSSLAAASLQELGLRRATDLEGGFVAWAAAGLPVVPA
jgi:rhodanese-related sulfurtransferase/predicted metal-dependent enzyme (double-stranded beta helix superfamily)